MELSLKPIATVESCYRDRFAVPRQPLLVQDSWAFLRFDSRFQPELSLQGLEGYSHLWILFGFHLNKQFSTNCRFHAKVHPPRLEGETMGVFATRSPHRPNPIGLSLVTISEVTKDGIIVLGADLADGTPVYDIKPYLPDVEAHPEARGGWSGALPQRHIAVRFATLELEREVEKWANELGQPQLRRLIVETLENDPRPLIYKAAVERATQVQANYKENHAFRLFNGDIHFKEVAGEIVVTAIFKSKG